MKTNSIMNKYEPITLVIHFSLVQSTCFVGPAHINDMHTLPPQKEQYSFFFVQNIAQCSKTNEKPIFRFIVFEIWSFTN